MKISGQEPSVLALCKVSFSVLYHGRYSMEEQSRLEQNHEGP
jgi:hypothetical protein